MIISKFSIKTSPEADPRGYTILAYFDARNADFTLVNCALVRFTNGTHTVFGPSGLGRARTIIALPVRKDLTERALATYRTFDLPVAA